MWPRMRKAILVGLAAACGNTPTKPTSPELGASHVEAAERAEVKPAPVDPHLAFRTQFSNPGGMWMPSQMTLPQHVDTFEHMGVQMASGAKTLSDPLSEPLAAIVSLGGCTGSFVSPDGLVVTNHHCAVGALKFNATKDNN